MALTLPTPATSEVGVRMTGSDPVGDCRGDGGGGDGHGAQGLQSPQVDSTRSAALRPAAMEDASVSTKRGFAKPAPHRIAATTATADDAGPMEQRDVAATYLF